MNQRLFVLLGFMVTFGFFLGWPDPSVSPAAESPAAMDCAAIKNLATQLKNLQITRSEMVTNDVQYPAYCLVQGKVNERTGIDGKTYAIGFEMRLPIAWNGRFLFQVNGGNDGVVWPAEGDPRNLNAVGRVTALARGFAVLSTDAGHQGNDPVNASNGLLAGNMFGFDPQARSDYGYATTGTMTPIAKSIIKGYYGRDPLYSYMFGCSNGGAKFHNNSFLVRARWNRYLRARTAMNFA